MEVESQRRLFKSRGSPGWPAVVGAMQEEEWVVGMVSHPPTARGTWTDTWHEEEVSKHPPGWLCD